MHQKIFYALDEMGLIPSMHRKVFYAIHGRRMRLDKTQEIGDFMQSQGVDSVKFLERMESFSVQSKAKQAAKLAADYKIDGVPAIGIQGRFYTSGGLVGNLEGVVAVSNFLIDKVRNKG
jgi:thiol:disulfide interchange protein DsbA